MLLSIYNYSFYHQICSLHFNHSQETVSFYTLVNSLLPSRWWPLRVYPYENLKERKGNYSILHVNKNKLSNFGLIKPGNWVLWKPNDLIVMIKRMFQLYTRSTVFVWFSNTPAKRFDPVMHCSSFDYISMFIQSRWFTNCFKIK